MNEVKKHGDPEVVRTLERKLESYKTLKTKAGDTPEISKLRGEDRNENDKVDTSIRALGFCPQVRGAAPKRLQ